MTEGIYIVAGKRTPFGKRGGMFLNCPPEDMFAAAAGAALTAVGAEPEWIDTVNIGQVSSLSKTGMSARHAALKAGLPQATPVLALNNLSGSGFNAIINSTQELLLGSAQVSLAGGMENLSAVPLLVRDARFGIPLGSNLVLEDFGFKSYYDSFCKMQLVQMSDGLAQKFNITRREVDEWALISQNRWKAAHDIGIFNTELAPVTMTQTGRQVTVTTDEFPQPDTTIGSLSALPPLYKGGTTTAGNVCGINDGAGAVVLVSEDALTQHNLTPLSRVVGWSCVGVDPALMGIGPVPAVRNLLRAAGLTIKDIDLFEIHETYAAQLLACAKELDVDRSKLNVNGGGIAIGHPSGASGARITSHLTHELRRRKLKRGVACACVAGGQGIALLIEAL